MNKPDTVWFIFSWVHNKHFKWDVLSKQRGTSLTEWTKMIKRKYLFFQKEPSSTTQTMQDKWPSYILLLFLSVVPNGTRSWWAHGWNGRYGAASYERITRWVAKDSVQWCKLQSVACETCYSREQRLLEVRLCPLMARRGSVLPPAGIEQSWKQISGAASGANWSCRWARCDQWSWRVGAHLYLRQNGLITGRHVWERRLLLLALHILRIS